MNARDVRWDIERCVSGVPGACDDCSKNKLRIDFPNCMEQLLKDAYGLLRKQVPAPIKGNTLCQCPSCDEVVLREWKHCPECGQALDWRYEE